MKVQPMRSFAFLCAAAMLCGALLLGPAAWAQPAPGPGAPVDIDRLHQQLVQQLSQVWSEVIRGVGQDPEFLDSAEAEPLMMQAEALSFILSEMREALQPQGPGPGPTENGRFQFVEWIQPGLTYWVLDTRTGHLHPREAPALEE